MLFRTESDLHMNPAGMNPCHVAIIGGGFAGASVARCLALSGKFGSRSITVFEPRERLGAGLAYDVGNPALRLNVAAHRMRALPDKPEAFFDFLRESGRLSCDPDALAGPDVYARRADFAAFMHHVMEPYLAAGIVDHQRDTIVDVRREGHEWALWTLGGKRHVADCVVVAIGHPHTVLPSGLKDLAHDDTRLLLDPDTVEATGPNDRILIVGAGLTALDFMATLEAHGHAGTYVVLSRSGLLPQAQASMAAEPFGDFLSPPARSALDLLRATRAAISQSEANGQSWHCVFDALRKHGQSIWQALPDAEKARFMRHLRRRYETHRFRMPPQNEALLNRLMREGRFTSIAGQLEGIRDDGKAIEARLRLRRPERVETRLFDRIAVATGPDQSRHFQTQPWLKRIARPAQSGLGMACDRNNRVQTSNGIAVSDLFVVGPPTRATFGEITGAPEIAAQAQSIANEILALSDADRAPLLT